MYYVYLLHSETNGKIYTGFTSDLKRRLKQHLQEKVHTTARMGKVKLIFYEAFLNEMDARERENYFKSTKGKRTVKLMLKYSIAPIV